MATFTNAGGNGDGVVGITTSHDVNGVVGHNSATTPRVAPTAGGNGVYGNTLVPDGAGVLGLHPGFGIGTAGVSLIGVWGGSLDGVGVMGVSAPPGAKGGDGVQGITNNEIRNGIYGRNDSTTPRGNDDPLGNGVLGWSGVPDGAGVMGIGHVGVKARSNHTGVDGQGQFGVIGSGDVMGVWGIGQGVGWAGYFSGPVYVAGTSDFEREVAFAADAHFDHNVLVNGNVVISGDIVLTNAADCAEDFDVSESSQSEPGTVMVLGAAGQLEACARAYDKRVVGVVSGAEGFKPGLVLDKKSDVSGRRPIALMGKVFCKVDAGHGSIEPGDLLTTSPTQGHAMRAEPGPEAFGSVIGKALQPLDSGCGLIAAVVALQ